MWGEEVLKTGFDKTVTLYRRKNGWTAVPLKGVSLRCTCSQKALERAQRSHVQAGVSPRRELRVLVPESLLNENFCAEPGDLLLIGEGADRLESPSDLQRQGREAAVIFAVTDRRERRLPYLLLEGR